MDESLQHSRQRLFPGGLFDMVFQAARSPFVRKGSRHRDLQADAPSCGANDEVFPTEQFSNQRLGQPSAFSRDVIPVPNQHGVSTEREPKHYFSADNIHDPVRHGSSVDIVNESEDSSMYDSSESEMYGSSVDGPEYGRRHSSSVDGDFAGHDSQTDSPDTMKSNRIQLHSVEELQEDFNQSFSDFAAKTFRVLDKNDKVEHIATKCASDLSAQNEHIPSAPKQASGPDELKIDPNPSQILDESEAGYPSPPKILDGNEACTDESSNNSSE